MLTGSLQVTFGLAVSGQLPWLRIAFLIPAQILASMCAGGLVRAMVPGDISAANTTLSAQTSIAQGVFLEMLFTAQLVFVVLMLAVEKSRDTFLAPVGIGLTVFTVMVAGTFKSCIMLMPSGPIVPSKGRSIANLVLGTPYTGASINPARSLGCAVASSFPGYHWIYWIGPLLGAALAAAFYRFIKFANYQDANPGQDSAGDEQGLP